MWLHHRCTGKLQLLYALAPSEPTKECVTWAEKMTQQLKAGISFIEDPSSVPSTEVR